jgi:hypothetical protein
MGGGGGSDDEPVVVHTADQIAQAQINAKLWNYYETEYKPVVDKFISRVTDPVVQEAEERKITGQVNAEVMKNVKPENVDSNPVVNEKRLLNIGDVEVGAEMQGQGSARSRKLGTLKNVVDIGQGNETVAGAGISELASQSLQSEISNISIQDQEQAAVENAYGSLAGAMAAGLLKAGTKTETKKRTLNGG